LAALWREVLLAKKVLEGKTKGYKHHPQLVRFRRQNDPVSAINAYLWPVLAEGTSRGFNFDASKVDEACHAPPIPVTYGQLMYEWKHLLSKLYLRASGKYEKLSRIERPKPHPLIVLMPRQVEPWEIVH